MGITDYGIKEGNTANLLILSGKDEMDVLRRMSVPLYSIRNGRILSTCAEKLANVYVDGKEQVDFTL